MKTRLRVAIVGSSGRMGQTINAVAESESTEIISKIDLGDPIMFDGADVAIDFSQPDAIDTICDAAAKAGIPLVIGTTGHSVAQLRKIESTASRVPIVLASNFSVGVNALFWLAEQAGRIVGDSFDIEIIETHHRLKKDAPSGTAKTLAEILQGCRQLKRLRHGREGMLGERDSSEIGVHAVRGGDIIGDHTVLFAGPGERLELTHRATNRETFARGALRASHWVVGKTAALYNMRDVLGLK